MSAISEKVRVALYAKLNVSGVTTLATGGVHESVAPDDVSLPYVIFARQGSSPITYSMGSTSPTQQLESDLWLIKAVTDEDSATSKSGQGLGEEILAACITALGTSLTLSGNTAVWYARFSDMPSYQEMVNDRWIYHRGMLWQIAVT